MDAGVLRLRLQLKTRLGKLFRILILQFMMRVFALAVANVLAANRARLFMNSSGSLAAIVPTAGQFMIFAHLFRTAALRAAVHALAITVLALLAARTSAVAAEIMIILDVLLAAHRIHARTMMSLIARGLVTAKALITPELTAHAAGSVRIGLAAGIGHTASAVNRIAVVLRIALTGLVLRNSIAVLAHNLIIVAAAGTGIMTFHAAGSQLVIPAVAADMARITAGRTEVIVAIGHAVAELAAGCQLMLHTVACIVALRAAHSLAVLLTIAIVVTARKHLVRQTVALIVARLAADSRRMVLAVGNAVTFRTTGWLAMLLRLVAGIMALCTAGCRQMLTAVTVIVTPDAAGSLIMVHAVAIEVTLHPAGLRTVMIDAIELLMARLLAGRLGRVICRHRADRQHAHQQHNRQQQRHHFLQNGRLLKRFCAFCADHNTLWILYNSC